MEQQELATSICRRLVEAGYTAYFAGGWVRDYLMGHPSNDIDIATSATSEQVMELFSHTVPVGIAFQSLVVVESGFHFEVSTFRSDLEYTNGRKPDKIDLVGPEEDAQRRDFTINGMFYDPLTEKILDYVDGHADLERRLLRAIGNAHERFREDRLRMIRGVRIAARFGFEVEALTEQAISAQADTLFPAVAIERVWQELQKMRAYPGFDAALLHMHKLGLLQVIFPELEGEELTWLSERVATFRQMPEDAGTILFILQLFPALPVDATESLCHYLRVSNRDKRLALLFRQVQAAAGSTEFDDLQWARLYAQAESRTCLEAVAAALPDAQRRAYLDVHSERMQRLAQHIERIRFKDPLVCASDLQARGLGAGPQMGALLKEAERIAVNQDLADKGAVMLQLEASSLWPGKAK